MGTWEAPSDGFQVEVDPTHRALRGSIRPNDGTHYRAVMTSGVLTAQAAGNGQYAAMRWTSPDLLCVIHHIWCSITVTTATAGQTPFPIALQSNRPYTAIESGGSPTTVTVTQGQVRAGNTTRPSHMTLAIASTGIIFGGTSSSDGIIGVGYAPLLYTSALGQAAQFDLFKQNTLAQHPLIYEMNEGFVVGSNVNAGTSTGAWTGVISVGFAWSEVGSY